MVSCRGNRCHLEVPAAASARRLHRFGKGQKPGAGRLTEAAADRAAGQCRGMQQHSRCSRLGRAGLMHQSITCREKLMEDAPG